MVAGRLDTAPML